MYLMLEHHSCHVESGEISVRVLTSVLFKRCKPCNNLAVLQQNKYSPSSKKTKEKTMNYHVAFEVKQEYRIFDEIIEFLMHTLSLCHSCDIEQQLLK